MRICRSGASALLLVILSGCKGCESESTLPALLEAEDATPVAVWVAEGLGAAPVMVPVYAVNALGAPVPGDALALASAATVPGAATPGVDGWAEVEVTGAPGRYTIDATAGGASGAGDAWITAARTGAIDLPAAVLPATPTQLAPAGNGLAAAVGNEVWWVAFDGRPPARVLSLPDPIEDLSTYELDADGVSDLLVTSGSHVVALRGRDAGGLYWGAGWAAAGDRPVIGASAGDLNGDNLVDLVVAVEDGGVASLLFLTGDGAWAFSPADALALSYAALDVSLDDLDDDGVGEVTLLTDAGLLRRYTKLDDSWTATLTGTQYELDLGEGARLLPSTDVTGDGVPELLAAGPSLLDPAVWHAWVVTAGAEDPARYELASTSNGYAWTGLAVADLSGDGAPDVVYVTPGKLARGTWSAADGNFLVSSWEGLPDTAAIALLDADGDGVADLAAGTADGVRVVRGARDADVPETEADETNPWRPATAAVQVFGLDLLLPPVVGDVTGDGIVDVVGLVQATDTGGVALEGVLGVAATDTTAETLRSGGRVTITGSGAPLDLAVCGDRAFVLYEEADDAGNVRTWLARADLASGMGPTLEDALAVEGELLVCGAFADGEVAVIDAAGGVSYVGADGEVVAGGSGAAYVDAVAIDPDGDGLDELFGCDEADCRVGAGDLDGDGVLDRVRQTSTGISAWFGDTEVLVDAIGDVTVGDADGDGVDELIVGDQGLVRVFHGFAGALSPAVASWTWRPVHDAAWYGDLDGDGLPDAFFLGEDWYPDTESGDTWIGVLLYAPAE